MSSLTSRCDRDFLSSRNHRFSLCGLRLSPSPLNFAGWGSLIFGLLHGPASPWSDIVFCGGGGGAGGGGVSLSTALSTPYPGSSWCAWESPRWRLFPVRLAGGSSDSKNLFHNTLASRGLWSCSWALCCLRRCCCCCSCCLVCCLLFLTKSCLL